jgi:N6-adenosine-specific RNA methylase IME4
VTDLVRQADVVLPGTASEVGLQLPEDLSFEDWEATGDVLRQINKACLWWWGDWLNFGEQAPYGEKYSQALETTDWDYQTLKGAAWVSQRIPMVRRRTILSHSHHKEVAALKPDEQDAWLHRAEEDSLNVHELRRAIRRAQRPVTNGLPIPAGLFSTIVIDPPWQYDNKATRGAAVNHYETWTFERLETLEIPAAENAHLYLWVTNGFLREGFDLLQSWGFDYKTMLTWVKPQIGLGNYFRSATEHVLFGLKGSLPTNGQDVSNWFQADRKKHSEKPELFYDIVEKVSPEPWFEMFARRTRFNWTTWGDQK